MNDSNFQIEQQCPQCGAPIILDESDRILACQFCRTRVYLATEDHFRLYLPPQKDIAEDIFFVPYWRVKGLSYTIRPFDIAYKYFDTNTLALESQLLPHSLGLRPQAMKLKFVGDSSQTGRFIASSHQSTASVLEKYQNFTGGKDDREIFIGETKSLIYTPVYFAHDQLYDAILKKPLLNQSASAQIRIFFEESMPEKWHVEFIPLLCPNCGADLPGEKDALILFCNNCHTAWNPSERNFPRVNYFTWHEQGDDVIYIPFWQMQVKTTGIALETYADLIRVANLPKAPAEIWNRIPFYFQIPAFKVHPLLFLRWCRQMTAQPAPADLSDVLPMKNIYPVTLPISEALDSSLITLASLMTDKRHLQETTASLQLELKDYAIVLHPFRVTARELIHAKLGFSMDITSLHLGAYL